MDILAELAAGGRALELGIGTGTYALPLAARGVEVHGIDASEAMVDELRAKDGGEAIPVTIGDFADVEVEGAFSLVFVISNTFFMLNWFMAFGVLAALVITYLHKREVGADSDTNSFICANAAFYAAAFLAILFFWNWFDDLTVGEDGQGQTRRNFWVVIDALFVIIVGAISTHLWREPSRD